MHHITKFYIVINIRHGKPPVLNGLLNTFFLQ